MADGTAQQCGRVGSCHILLKTLSIKLEQGFFMPVRFVVELIIGSQVSFIGKAIIAFFAYDNVIHHSYIKVFRRLLYFEGKILISLAGF